MKKLTISIAALMLICGSINFAYADEASRKAYDLVLEEIQTLEHSVTTQTSMSEVMKIFDQVEKKLVDFTEDYPGTDEAQDAKFQLGVLNANINNVEKSKKYLEDYISSTPNAQRSKMGNAHFFLAETYLRDEKFDKAKKHYNVFINEYGSVDPKLVARAKTSLQDLDILRKLAIGNEAIEFKAKSLDGKTISIEKHKGKVVLLDFWATWCAPCRQEMPNVIKLYKQYHGKGFEIIGISLDRDRKALEKYLEDNGIEWSQYFDGNMWGNNVAQRYGIRSIPATFLLDKHGKIRYKSVRGRELARAVRKLIDEK